MGPETNKIIGDWTEDVEKNLWFRNSPANVTEAHTHRGLKWKVERGSAGHYHQISRWQCLRQHCTACNPCHTITLNNITNDILHTIAHHCTQLACMAVFSSSVSGALPRGRQVHPPPPLSLILSTSLNSHPLPAKSYLYAPPHISAKTI